MKKVLLISAALVSLVIYGCGGSTEVTAGDTALLLLTNSGKVAPMEDLAFDWGDINISGGNVKHTFRLKNDGEEDLIIKSASTSCMCTTAEVKVGEDLSPTFGMHGNIQWGYPVKPGQEFEVKVVFDPMAHGPNAVGPIQRSISLVTSSRPNGEHAKFSPEIGNQVITEIRASGNVLLQEEFQKKNSAAGFIFTETEFDFGTLKQSQGTVSKNFQFTYIGDSPINVTSVPTSCACTTAEISDKKFKKGDTGELWVVFDPNLHEEPEGKFFKTVSIMTDPPLGKQPEIKVWAQIDLDLGPEAYKLNEPHTDEELTK